MWEKGKYLYVECCGREIIYCTEGLVLVRYIYIYHIVVICEVLAVTMRPTGRTLLSVRWDHIVVMWDILFYLSLCNNGLPPFFLSSSSRGSFTFALSPQIKFHTNWQYNFIFRFCLCISIFHVKFDFICLNLMTKDWQIYFGSHMNLCFLSVSSRPELSLKQK